MNRDDSVWMTDDAPWTGQYETIDQSWTNIALKHLSKASYMRAKGLPEQWARDVERKALRRFEQAHWLRHLGTFTERPSFLPPPANSPDNV